MITLDGACGEGGGQVLRTALALSILTQQSFEINDIRAGREEKGLKAQHLSAVNAAQELCGAKVDGASIGSTRLVFEPQKISRTKFGIDVGTAGSVTLVLQAILMPCFFAKKITTLNIIGGTDVRWSPQINYFQEVFVPQIRKYCKSIDVQLVRRGYYPAGGGEIFVKIKPLYFVENYSFEGIRNLMSSRSPIKLTEQGHLMLIKGVSHASKQIEQAGVAERQAMAAEKELKKLFNCSVNIRNEYAETASIGSGIVLWAVFSRNDEDIDVENPILVCADELGEKGVSAEKVGQKVAEKLINNIYSKSPVDEHLADQLIPWMALFRGSQIMPSRITPHALTNAYVTEQFFGKCIKVGNKLIESF